LQRFEFAEPHMGTLYRIALYAPDKQSAQDAANAAFARIGQLDEKFTDYDDDSELMKLCAQSGGPPVAVSADLFDVLSRALEIGRQTRGAFDITVGPVVTLWRRARRKKELPDPQDIAAALTHMGLDNVVLNSAERTVTLKKPGMRLDLGGIAKGYAVDQALNLLRTRGLNRAMVLGGGDIGVGDPPPGKDGWAVEIGWMEENGGQEHDIRPPAHPKIVLLLKNAGVSTSGDQFQHLDLNGKRYSHVIDPKTGRALEGRRSVSVVAQNTTASDALAKVCVFPVKEALEVIDALPGTAVFYAVEEGQEIKTYPSQAWKTLPVQKE
jgi:thiamine biosynthesis lipoprotein